MRNFTIARKVFDEMSKRGCLLVQPDDCRLELSERMAAGIEEPYMPPPEFQEDAKDPLLDLSLNDSTELWLIQWPKNQVRNNTSLFACGVLLLIVYYGLDFFY